METGEVQCTVRGHSPDKEQCTCQHYDEDGDEDYEPDPDCPVKAHSSFVKAVAWSPCGQWLASGGDDKMIYVYDAKTFEVKWLLRGHANLVMSVSWSPDGTRLASGSLDKTVRLWDASTGAPIGSPLRGHRYAPSLSKECFLSLG